MSLQSITTCANSVPHREVPCGLVWTLVCLFFQGPREESKVEKRKRRINIE